jgi:hypothetical protein
MADDESLSESMPLKTDEDQDREITTDEGVRMRLCPGCGRIFIPYRSFQKFCSKWCRDKITKRRSGGYEKKPVVERECKNCHKPFRTNDDKKHYCSHECYVAFQDKRRKEPEERTCFYCEKKFKTTHFIKRYCSEECRRRAHGKSDNAE